MLSVQRINQLYKEFKNVTVTFNGEVIRALRIVPKEFSLKYKGSQWRCMVHSSSMTAAKALISIDKKRMAQFGREDSLVALRFCFMGLTQSNFISFFVPARVSEFVPYEERGDSLCLLSLTFTSRPPDDLVIILGSFVEANINSKRRSEERISLNTSNMRKLGFNPARAKLTIDGIPRKFVIKDISFSGTSVVISGIGKFLVDRKAVLGIDFEDSSKLVNLEGIIRRFEEVEGHRDIVVLGIQFDVDALPIEYKLRINDFLNSKTNLSSG